jgi:uncharacterized membrane protein (UPF0127 family)
MHIWNVTRDQVLATRIRVATHPWARGRGLIGMPPLQPGEALIIRPCKGIHTWLMSYPIDVIYVDREERVLDLDEAIPPWRFGRIRWQSAYVIELPAGVLRRTGTRPGDQLAFTQSSDLA